MAGPRPITIFLSCASILALTFFLFLTHTAYAQKKPSWWPDAEIQADRDGYALLDDQGMKSLLAGKDDFLLLDARPGYEFKEGHLPGALNLEFDLGDRTMLDPAKRQAFLDLAGPDKRRPIVIYCRSFR